MRPFLRKQLSPVRLLWLCGSLLAASSLAVLAFWGVEWHAIQQLSDLGAHIEVVDGCSSCNNRATGQQFVRLSHADFPNSRGLFCDNLSSGDEVLPYAKRISGLREISMSYCEISSQEFARFSGLNEICFLDLSSTALSDAEMVHLAKMRGLECLDISATQVSSVGISHLKKAQKLKCIIAEDCKIEDLELVGGFNSLQRIDVWDCPIVHARILGCAALSEVELGSSSLRVVQIADSPALKSVDLFIRPGAGAHPLDARIENLPSLTSLTLEAGDLSKTVVRGVPSLESICIESDRSFSEILQNIANEVRLKEVTLVCFERRTQEEALNALIRSRSRDSLRKVSLHPRWTTEVMKRLIDLPSIRHLDLSNNDLLDEDLELIERFPLLEKLNISANRRLSPKVIEKLMRSKSLRTVVADFSSNGTNWFESEKERAGHQIQFIVEDE